MNNFNVYQNVSFTPHKQNGAVLIISLIILLILSFLAVQGTQTATLEEKMAGNFRSKKVAFEAAEAALAAAEEWIDSQDSPPLASANGVNGVFDLGAVSIHDTSFWNSASVGVRELENSALYSLDTPPLFVIEQRQTESGPGGSAETGSNTKSSTDSDVFSYRITARGTGTVDSSVVMLQSHFERTF